MGRNSGGEIFFTLISDDSANYISTFYCQQHARWDTRINNTLVTAWNRLRDEIKTFHGNEEQ